MWEQGVNEMLHKVKVTVIDKKLYPELQEAYCMDPKSVIEVVSHSKS